MTDAQIIAVFLAFVAFGLVNYLVGFRHGIQHHKKRIK